MNIQDRLRHCAKHTGLDAVVELLNEAATHIEGLNSTPKLQGDPSWWMRETDEGAEWTDTAPLVLSGWTPLYTTAQPAQATQAEVTDSMIREAFLANGFTIKDGHSDLKPYVYAAARAILALRPERVPDDVMRDAERGRFLLEWLKRYGLLQAEFGQMGVGEKPENWWLLHAPWGIDKTRPFFGHGKTPEQAIDAAMLAAAQA